MNPRELRNLALGLALGFLGAGVLAGVSLPHTFTAGNPIRAGEVNANFAALNNALPGVAQTVSAGSAAITASSAVIDSVSINVPGPGYVRVSASAQLNIEYTGASAHFTFGVSDAPDVFSPDQDRRIMLPNGLPAWTYSYIVSSERVFRVDSAGPKTFYMLAEENSSAQGTVSRRVLTATYFTAMGTVQTP